MHCKRTINLFNEIIRKHKERQETTKRKSKNKKKRFEENKKLESIVKRWNHFIDQSIDQSSISIPSSISHSHTTTFNSLFPFNLTRMELLNMITDLTRIIQRNDILLIEDLNEIKRIKEENLVNFIKKYRFIAIKLETVSLASLKEEFKRSISRIMNSNLINSVYSFGLITREDKGIIILKVQINSNEQKLEESIFDCFKLSKQSITNLIYLPESLLFLEDASRLENEIVSLILNENYQRIHHETSKD